MPKYYCDYCDTYLTHDSPTVRKTHCAGRKHKDNVKMYYQTWMENQAQNLIDVTTAAFKAQNSKNPFACPPRGMPPPRLPVPQQPLHLMGQHFRMLPPGMSHIPPPHMMLPPHMMMRPPMMRHLIPVGTNAVMPPPPLPKM